MRPKFYGKIYVKHVTEFYKKASNQNLEKINEEAKNSRPN